MQVRALLERFTRREYRRQTADRPRIDRGTFSKRARNLPTRFEGDDARKLGARGNCTRSHRRKRATFVGGVEVQEVSVDA